MWRWLWVSLVLGALLVAVVPAEADGGPAQVVVITATPAGNLSCPVGFGITIVSAYELVLAWTPDGGNSTTLIKAAYGRLPTGPEDGFEIYEGTGNSTTHWVNTEFIGVDVYYRLYTETGIDSYDDCYVVGSVIGGASMTEIGVQLGNLSEYAKMGFILGFPFLLALVGAWRHSLTGYLCGITGFAIAIPLLDDALGLAVVIPASLLIAGLSGAMVRDALGEGLNIV